MKQQTWETPICNLCHGKEIEVVYKEMTYWEYEGVFTIVKCRNCDLVFLSPRPPLSEIGKYYAQEEYFGRNISTLGKKYDDKKERERMFGVIYKIIFSRKKRGSILDIGAGTGLFLSKFKDEGWKTDGIELLSDAVSYAKKTYGITLRQGDFFDYSYKNNTYAVVTLNGALEHLYTPQETLKKIHALLSKDGMIVISVPNSDSMGREIFGRNWFPWQPPRHLYHFSPKTIKKMLENAGFK